MFISSVATLFTLAFLNPIQQLQPVGQAQLSYLFWTVYNSTLYTRSGNYQVNEYPQALSITYLLEIKQEDLIENTRKQWQAIGVYDESLSETWLKQVAIIWPQQVTEKDNLTLLVDEQQHSHFYFNGKEIGAIKGVGFGKHFLAIWLSPDTEYPELRQKLIGQVNFND